MRTLFADFMDLLERPGLGLSVPLGTEDVVPDLSELHPGERVLLVQPDELRAEATVQPVEAHGRRCWYGIMESRAVIEIIDPDSVSGTGKQTTAASGTPQR